MAKPVSRAWIGIVLFLVLMFDPGIMSNDSIASLKQARAFEFTDWHPPIMAIIWSILDRFIAGPAGMLLCQAVLFAYASAKLCTCAFPRLMQRFPPWLVVAVFTLFPPAMTLTGMIWKDVWMSGFLLLALAHLFLLRDSSSPRFRLRHAVSVVLFCFAATAFRHNALAATAGVLAGMVYLFCPHLGRWLRLLAASAAGVLMSILLYICVAAVNSMVAQPAQPVTGIYLHDIAGIIVHSGEPQVAANKVLEHPVALTDDHAKFLARIHGTYTPQAAGRVIRTRRKPDTPFNINVYAPDHDADGVKQVHRDLMRAYPAAYLKHRTKAFACLLQLCGRDQWVEHSYVMNKRYVLPKSLNQESWQYTLRKWFLSDKLAPLYHPGFWLLITMTGGVLGFIRLHESPRPSLLLFMSLSALGLSFSLFFTSPIESYRYMHWVMLLGWCMAWMGIDAFVARHSSSEADPKNASSSTSRSGIRPNRIEDQESAVQSRD